MQNKFFKHLFAKSKDNQGCQSSKDILSYLQNSTVFQIECFGISLTCSLWRSWYKIFMKRRCTFFRGRKILTLKSNFICLTKQRFAPRAHLWIMDRKYVQWIVNAARPSPMRGRQTRRSRSARAGVRLSVIAARHVGFINEVKNLLSVLRRLNRHYKASR